MAFYYLYPEKLHFLGQIRRHTIVSSIIIYLGFLIGAVNLLILYPRIIPVEYMGLTKVIQDYSVILSSIASLGFIAPFYRFGPYYTSYQKPGNNDLMQLYLLVIHVGMIVVVLLSFLIGDWVKGYFEARSPLFSVYYTYTLAFVYLLILSNVFENYLATKGEAIIPSFIREVIIRIIILILLLAVFLGLNVKYFVMFYSIHYIIPVLVLAVYSMRNYPFAFRVPFSKTTRRLFRHIIGMASIGFVQNIVNLGVPVIDTIVVGGVVGLGGVASYLIMNYISTLVYVPVRATSGVLGAKVASYWKGNELDKIQILYQRTSMSYLIFSTFMISLILFNLDLAQRLIGKNIIISMSVILPLVLAKLFELSTGLSNMIIGYSKKWKIESGISICTVILAIPLNIFMVNRFGIAGAAVSTLILALLAFSTRIIVLYWIYRLFPFRYKTLGFLSFGVVIFIVFYILCRISNSLFAQMAWSVLYTFVFIVVILRFRFSEDINIVLNNIEKTIKKWMKLKIK